MVNADVSETLEALRAAQERFRAATDPHDRREARDDVDRLMLTQPVVRVTDLDVVFTEAFAECDASNAALRRLRCRIEAKAVRL